jgi:hypothetical protein
MLYLGGYYGKNNNRRYSILDNNFYGRKYYSSGSKSKKMENVTFIKKGPNLKSVIISK